ncbi:type II toxin-antitoxin system Phd/YefM family antitoxin [Saccharopolyspora sp. MS10]|uniref:type II toxin-antitoxin system Phd/YefM family antitoxin n=1 Tax=Saccharopolyspora sp. MS10 TaxID=3385973 RepID=UPI00399F90C9
MATEISADDAQDRLPELLDRVEGGEEIVITRFGVPSATLRPAADGGRSRTVMAGVVAGAWIPPVSDGLSHQGGFDVGTDYSVGDSGFSG